MADLGAIACSAVGLVFSQTGVTLFSPNLASIPGKPVDLRLSATGVTIFTPDLSNIPGRSVEFLRSATGVTIFTPDLSALLSRSLPLNRRPTSWWNGTYLNTQQFINFDVFGTISGYVLVNGYPAQRYVRLSHRLSGTLISTVLSDASTGAFSFPNLDRTDTYYAIAFETTQGASSYDALVYDYLTPV